MSAADGPSGPFRSIHHDLHHVSPFNLAGLSLIIVLIGLASAYWIAAIAPVDTGPKASAFEAPYAIRTIAGEELIVPQIWLRDGQTRTNFVDRMAINLWVALAPQVGPERLTLTFAPLSSAPPSAYLLDKVYLHEFQDRQINDGPNGLIGKPLVARDGYASEVVWYDPLSSTPFVAKCMQFDQNVPATCVRTVRLTPTLSVTYAFEQAALANWQSFDVALRPYLSQLGALD